MDTQATAGATVAVDALSHRYGGRGGLTVLEGVSLRLPAGTHVALTGPSGAGKSTLLSLLGGLERPQRGTITVDGDRVETLGGRHLAAYRRRTVGFVFQHFGLLELLTANENVAMALALAGMPRSRRSARAIELLAAVGLQDRLHHRPAQLSGGERQRVAIARALANAPRLLLADEPTGNLDMEAATVVLDLLDDVRREHGCTLVVVTHNPVVAERAELHLRLLGGRLVG